MHHWRIFVLAVVKQALNVDFDRLTELANEHRTMGQMLQHDREGYSEAPRYELQTVIDNVSLITEEIWAALNQVIVKFGHEVLGVGPATPLGARVDSYVVETNIRRPMDVALLHEGVQQGMTKASRAWNAEGLSRRARGEATGWRQLRHLRRTLLSAFRKVDAAKKYNQRPDAVLAYLALCAARLGKCEETYARLLEAFPDARALSELRVALDRAWALHDLVERRWVKKEKIPNSEKILSLHAPHTRWVKKGKAPPNEIEFGVPVAIIESDRRLIMGWEIMWKEEDVKMVIPILAKYPAAYPNLSSMSFDRGYWSPENLEASRSTPLPINLPKKGYLSQADRARQSTEAFQKARRNHAQVESRIHCLEQHGGGRIRTKGGKAGFARTVGASVVATNLCRIGAFLMDQRRTLLRQAA